MRKTAARMIYSLALLTPAFSPAAPAIEVLGRDNEFPEKN